MLLAGVLFTQTLAPLRAETPPPDDVDFLFRMGMLEGHLIVGHDLLKAGREGLALPHFGHPVQELYEDISVYTKAKNIPPFDTQLIKLEAAVAGSPKSPETEALYQAMIKTLQQVRMAAPAALRGSVPEMIKICADTIDAAAGEYSEAVNGGKLDALVEYHDSRGYLAYVAQETDALAGTHTDDASKGLIGRFRAVLAKAQWIVEPLLPQPGAACDGGGLPDHRRRSQIRGHPGKAVMRGVSRMSVNAGTAMRNILLGATLATVLTGAAAAADEPFRVQLIIKDTSSNRPNCGSRRTVPW